MSMLQIEIQIGLVAIGGMVCAGFLTGAVQAIRRDLEEMRAELVKAGLLEEVP